MALECLLRLASTRRSLFSNDTARMKFLSHLMLGTKEILQTGIGLADHDNYHAFCRLLGRFKVNYQLSELVNAEGYSEWIRLVAEFTLKSLHSWKWAGSSVYYLLNLWSRSVTSVRYLKSDKPNLLDEYVPKVIEGFVSSRFDSLQSELSDELGENPLDNVEVLQDQLEFFPFLCRFQYESCSSYLMKIVEPIMKSYMNEIHVDSYELSVTESKLAWFTHIVAAILRTKQISGSSGESHEILDAEISACVLQLINICDSGFHSKRYGDVSKQRLDRAILTFLQHLRRCYIGDQAVYSSKQLYTRLSELLGLHDHLLLLNVIVGKMTTNLKYYTKCKEVIDHTLNLFLEMTSGYMSGKLLLKLDTVKHILSNQNNRSLQSVENSLLEEQMNTLKESNGTASWLALACDHGSPIGLRSHLKQRHVSIFPRLVMRSYSMAIMKNSAEEVVEGNGGTNMTKMGKMKSRHRKRSRQGCKEWLHGCKEWRHRRRWEVLSSIAKGQPLKKVVKFGGHGVYDSGEFELTGSKFCDGRFDAVHSKVSH
ncbi:hypothetical protein JHK85_028278 [Glycine max]|nr:hypothetical protein JHK85_028278 [Glycine max]